MNRNWIGGLSIAIIVMIAIVMVSSIPRDDRDQELGKLVLPGLKTDLSRIEKVIVSGEDASSNLQLTEGKWLVAERFQFEADSDKLTDLLKLLAASKLQETKTGKPENFSRLGVEKGTTVRLLAGDKVYLILVGKSDPNRDGHYVRLYKQDSEDSLSPLNQVWLTDSELDVPADPSSWLAKEVLDVEAEKIQGVELNDGKDVLKISRKDGALQIEDLAAGVELQYSTVVDSIGRALSNVRMEDVVPMEQVDFTASNQAVFSLDDETEIKIQIVEENGSYWLRLIDHEKSDWAFQVSQVVYKNLTKRLEDFIKQEEVEAQPG